MRGPLICDLSFQTAASPSFRPDASHRPASSSRGPLPSCVGFHKDNLVVVVVVVVFVVVVVVVVVVV